MSERGPFSPVVVGFLVAGVVAIFALSVVLSSQIKEDEGGYRATRSSPSAIGHVGFFTLLQKLDLPVGYSKTEQAKSTKDTGLLIVQEPSTVLNKTAASLDLDAGPDVLVVLPKYWGERDHSHDGWVRKTGLLDLTAVQRVLRLLDVDAKVTRRADPIPPGASRIAVMPTMGPDTQMIAGPGLVPIIGTKDRMLLAEVETPSDQHLYVLADPDPLENHGIADPANARFAVALVRLLWNGHKAIVFDESVHGGYVEKRSPLELLFQFPYNIVLGQRSGRHRAAAARDHRAIWRLGAGAAALHARQDPAHRQHRRADGPGRSPGRRAAPLHPVRAAGRRTCAARAARPRRYAPVADRVSLLFEGKRRRTHEIVTPEGVALRVDVAERSERLGAFLLDMLFWMLGTVVVFLGLILAGLSHHGKDLGDDGDVAATIVLFLAFLLRNLYFMHFELAWRGRTPGKTIMGLRVIDRSGGALTASAIVARNITREVEIFLRRRCSCRSPRRAASGPGRSSPPSAGSPRSAPCPSSTGSTSGPATSSPERW